MARRGGLRRADRREHGGGPQRQDPGALHEPVTRLVDLIADEAGAIPTDNTELKTNGIYSLSRNPMYLGFNLLTISSVIYTLNFVVIILGIYSIIIYHLIILGEEKYLSAQFLGDAFSNLIRKQLEDIFRKINYRCNVELHITYRSIRTASNQVLGKLISVQLFCNY